MIDAQAPVEEIAEIDSTMLEARRRAERGEIGPVWLIAKRQSAGRGRRGRMWASLDGNLFATYLGPTAWPPAQIAMLGFAAGLALAEAIESLIGAGRITLKWPNDVMQDGAKVAGILIESGGPWLALAFGVNVAVAPKALDQPTTSVREGLPREAETPPALDFFALARPRLEAWCARLASEGFEPLRQAWLARAHGLGGAAKVALGAETLHGVIAGLSERGELELDTPSGRRLISAGDVMLTTV